MARLNSAWRNFVARGQAWYHFWEDAVSGAVAETFEAAVSATGTVAASLTTAITFAADVSGSAVATAALTTAITLAASVSASATTTADLTTAITPAASVSASATVQADLSTAITLAADVSGTVTVPAALTTAITFAADVTSNAEAFAEFPTTAAEFVADVSCSAVVTANLATEIPFAASVGASATTQADLSTSILFDAWVTGEVTVDATLGSVDGPTYPPGSSTFIGGTEFRVGSEGLVVLLSYAHTPLTDGDAEQPQVISEQQLTREEVDDLIAAIETLPGPVYPEGSRTFIGNTEFKVGTEGAIVVLTYKHTPFTNGDDRQPQIISEVHLTLEEVDALIAAIRTVD